MAINASKMYRKLILFLLMYRVSPFSVAVAGHIPFYNYQLTEEPEKL